MFFQFWSSVYSFQSCKRKYIKSEFESNQQFLQCDLNIALSTTSWCYFLLKSKWKYVTKILTFWSFHIFSFVQYYGRNYAHTSKPMRAYVRTGVCVCANAMHQSKCHNVLPSTGTCAMCALYICVHKYNANFCMHTDAANLSDLSLMHSVNPFSSIRSPQCIYTIFLCFLTLLSVLYFSILLFLCSFFTCDTNLISIGHVILLFLLLILFH